MVTVIISSSQDIASMNIKNEILSISEWEEIDTFFDVPVYKNQSMKDLFLITLEDKAILHENLVEQIHDEINITPTQAIYISRHRSKTGNPTLTTHPIGNYGKAEFGGKERTLSTSHPYLMTQILRNIHALAKKEKMIHQVCFEVTHHGPYMSIPTLFAEVGSSQTEWEKRYPAHIVAQSVLTALSESQNKQKNCILQL